jgi:cyclic pyranopterin phosphate synthase
MHIKTPTETFSHLDEQQMPRMVNITEKKETTRRAHARTLVELGESILSLLTEGDLRSKKGPVFQTAIIAGTMAVKKTGDLIPLCHPLFIEDCRLSIEPLSNTTIAINCIVITTGKTGVEMEALMGASIAALTVYDMCKALSHGIIIRETMLISKQGGKNDFERA